MSIAYMLYGCVLGNQLYLEQLYVPICALWMVYRPLRTPIESVYIYIGRAITCGRLVQYWNIDPSRSMGSIWVRQIMAYIPVYTLYICMILSL